MRSYNNLYEPILQDDYIKQCFINASKKKKNRNDVREVLENLDEHTELLKKMLTEELFIPDYHKPSIINESSSKKTRRILKPHYKYEQVIHHCAIGQFKPIVMNGLYEFSCGSIPGRGVHYGKKYMRKWLDSYDGKKFFVLKMDVHHFFESINRRILKRKLKEVIRDKRFYRLLCILIEHDKIALVAKILTDAGVEIDAEQTKTLVGCIAFDDISGALEILQEIGVTGAMFDELKEIIEEMRKGVPLGYFTSQWFGNFYLKALDHYIKEELRAEHYMRYMDDMVILGKSKKKLHKIHAAIETYLNDNLDLEIKGDWQVFRFEYPVFDKGGNPVLDKDGKQVTNGRMLDFMGFQFHHDRTTIRKSNIEAARRKANHISKQNKISWYNASVMLSYMGLFKHTDTYNYYIDYIKPKINEDNILGKLSDSRYATLDAQYEKEQSELTAEISALEKAVKSYEKHEKDADRFIALIDKYENFDKLTIAMLNEFIEKILVHERDRKGSIQTTQEVEIYFNFVGRFVPPAFGEVELTPEELEEIRKREERKDRLHQNYLKRKASGAQKRYEDKIKGRKKAEIEAKKAAIRAEDIAKGVFVPVSSLPQREPMKGVQTA